MEQTLKRSGEILLGYLIHDASFFFDNSQTVIQKRKDDRYIKFGL